MAKQNEKISISEKKFLEECKNIHTDVDKYIRSSFDDQVRYYNVVIESERRYRDLREREDVLIKNFSEETKQQLKQQFLSISYKMFLLQTILLKVNSAAEEFDGLIELVAHRGKELITEKQYTKCADYIKEVTSFMNNYKTFIEYPTVTTTNEMQKGFIKAIELQLFMVKNIQKFLNHNNKEIAENDNNVITNVISEQYNIGDFYKDFIKICVISNGLDISNSAINDVLGSLKYNNDVLLYALSQFRISIDVKLLSKLVNNLLENHYDLIKVVLNDPELLPINSSKDFIKFCKDIIAENNNDFSVELIKKFVDDNVNNEGNLEQNIEQLSAKVESVDASSKSEGSNTILAKGEEVVKFSKSFYASNENDEKQSDDIIVIPEDNKNNNEVLLPESTDLSGQIDQSNNSESV